MLTVHVENLTKKFDGLVAVDSVSFDIEEGEIFGLLGPNGAGKTTMISMLSTLLKPTSGTAMINGLDILTEEDGVRKSIGIVFQDQSLDEELTAYENMDFHGRLYRIQRSVRQERIIELLHLVELEDRKDDLVKTFSGGMRRRLEIARGLLHHPKVLFLDEPTLGLDSQTRNHLWDYIERLNKEKGITIILTTHYMDEADKFCDRVAIIDRGKLIALDSPQNLKEEIGDDLITIRCSDDRDVQIKIDAPWVKHIEKHDGIIIISLKNVEKHIAEIISIINQNKIDVESISIQKPDLEDVFLHFTGKTIREQEADPKESMRMFHRVRGR
ncbi:MAG: ATP-binding cassette domain-containing protein [Methermicoccaceae archaeon]